MCEGPRQRGPSRFPARLGYWSPEGVDPAQRSRAGASLRRRRRPRRPERRWLVADDVGVGGDRSALRRRRRADPAAGIAARPPRRVVRRRPRRVDGVDGTLLDLVGERSADGTRARAVDRLRRWCVRPAGDRQAAGHRRDPPPQAVRNGGRPSGARSRPRSVACSSSRLFSAVTRSRRASFPTRSPGRTPRSRFDLRACSVTRMRSGSWP